MLIDEIKKANVQALKARDSVTKGILGVVMNKYMLLTIEKRDKNQEPTDEDMIKIIQKTIKELNDERAGYLEVNSLERADNCLKQIHAIEIYLPKMLSEDEIKAEIEKLDDKSMPSIMKHFKSNFNGKVDMSLVSSIAKTYK